jgi:hypothetical protein
MAQRNTTAHHSIPVGHSGTAGSLAPLEAYAARPGALFPSVPSLRWAIRENRERFAKAGALVILRGRIFLDVERFEREAVEIGRSVATRGID